ncbi:hypothetical protein CCACVL1_02382 [Corchorus capsularis]|uniref:Uncharacterized protein n=1 Tax=Corchorus capsularis TaxID=210143 RepID=A0A1R3K8Y4_COCAP|nr:hypothetical protein CCACVL1_02382 [Corchorus capsularis]
MIPLLVPFPIKSSRTGYTQPTAAINESLSYSAQGRDLLQTPFLLTLYWRAAFAPLSNRFKPRGNVRARQTYLFYGA